MCHIPLLYNGEKESNTKEWLPGKQKFLTLDLIPLDSRVQNKNQRRFVYFDKASTLLERTNRFRTSWGARMMSLQLADAKRTWWIWGRGGRFSRILVAKVREILMVKIRKILQDSHKEHRGDPRGTSWWKHGGDPRPVHSKIQEILEDPHDVYRRGSGTWN